MNKVAAFALRRKNSILSMSEKMFCPPQPLRFWITPACAGKSRRKTTDRFCSRDHPRVCGEKGHGSELRGRQVGSPPRVRGKVQLLPVHHDQVGITPAYAEKRIKLRKRHSICGDHPRVCGEKLFQSPLLRLPLGSSPRMRGKDVRQELQHSGRGITPACAGKSPQRAHCSPVPWDHPRVCGEKCPPGKFFFMTVGSPPRVRGKEVRTQRSDIRSRITPAHAGKSSIQHLTASLGEFEVQKGHPVFHLRQRLQVWPDHARHLRHGLILHASRSAGQGRRLCPGPCPDTAGSGTPRGPSPAKRPHTSPPAATPGGCRAWQSGATAPGSR